MLGGIQQLELPSTPSYAGPHERTPDLCAWDSPWRARWPGPEAAPRLDCHLLRCPEAAHATAPPHRRTG